MVDRKEHIIQVIGDIILRIETKCSYGAIHINFEM